MLPLRTKGPLQEVLEVNGKVQSIHRCRLREFSVSDIADTIGTIFLSLFTIVPSHFRQKMAFY